MAIDLSPVHRKFILHWGEMGARWGINRTIAQIHALLYLSDRPLNAEEIVETLSVARSNVSTSLRELQTWGIVRVIHVMGDRRDHFEATTDVWEMFRIILDERKRREVDPTIRLLRECILELEKQPSAATRSNRLVARRLREMLDFFETMTSWYGHMRQLPRNAVLKFVRMGGRLRKLIAS